MLIKIYRRADVHLRKDKPDLTSRLSDPLPASPEPRKPAPEMLAATARHAARRGSATAVPRRCSSLRAQLRRTQPNSADGAAAAAPRYYSTAAQVAAAAAAADCAIPSPDECWSGGQLTSLTPEVLAHAEQTFLKNGMCFFPSALSAEWVANAHDTAVQRWTHNLARLPGGDLEVGMEHGYAEVVHRARGRYDMLDGIDGQAPFADADAVVAPLMQRLLGQDCHRLFNGLLMTRPGSSEQLWHVDGEHLFSTPSGEAEDVSGSAAALPAHCVNVFVPLVDITRSNGATEFCASHTHAHPALRHPTPCLS